MTELWKPIVGFEGLYEVSNLGRVRSLPKDVPYKGSSTFAHRKGRILSLVSDSYGYKIVNLSKDRNQCGKKVHRLVAEAFLENPSNLPQVNHKDGNKENNSVGNLEWCTAKQNIRHKFDVLGYTTKDIRPGRKVSMPDGRVFISIKAAARALGVTPGTVRYRIEHETL